MQFPKFQEPSLVTYQDNIYEVMGLASNGPGFYYRLILVASQKHINADEFQKLVVKPEEIVLEESLLEKFDGKKPKFQFGEIVKLNGINCIVIWIEYKNFNYHYSVKEKNSHDGSLSSYGWIKEESYLQKR